MFREFGLRHWIAWVLVRAAYRTKNTTTYQVIRTADGSALLIEADAWGGGANAAYRVDWAHDDGDDNPPHPGWPRVREFETFDEALEWMHGSADTFGA